MVGHSEKSITPVKSGSIPDATRQSHGVSFFWASCYTSAQAALGWGPSPQSEIERLQTDGDR